MVLVLAATICGTSNAEEWVRQGARVLPKWQLDLYASNPSCDVTTSLQVLVSSNEVGLLCTGVNKEQHPIIAALKFSQGNNLVYIYGDKELVWKASPAPDRYIPPNGTSIWTYDCRDLRLLRDLGVFVGLAKVEWRFMTTRSNPLWISAPVQSGRIIGWPIESWSSNRMIVSRLAYVPGTTNGGDIAFFLWNGTSQSMEISDSSICSNSLLAVAPTVKYVQKLNAHELWATNFVILPQTSAQWSVPIKSLINFIPQSAISKIASAGGGLDIVWSFNGCESEALPLCVGERPKTEYEKYVDSGTEFLKKYDGVPQVGANAKIAISLRLAGGGTEPMLVARVVSEETENLVGNIGGGLLKGRGRYDYGMGGDASAKVQGGGYFLVPPKETIEIRTSPSILREVAYLSGKMVELDFEFSGHSNGTMWLAFPNESGQIREVRAIRESSSPAILAFAYSGETNSGFAFVLWNNTAQPLSATKLNSRIVLSMPAMDYKREFKLDGVEFARGAIATNMHEACFVPWDAVMKQIPSEDLARLKKAGSEVDLTWKIGVWESRPLSLLLSSSIP
jgi:hypothetical protein